MLTSLVPKTKSTSEGPKKDQFSIKKGLKRDQDFEKRAHLDNFDGSVDPRYQEIP